MVKKGNPQKDDSDPMSRPEYRELNQQGIADPETALEKFPISSGSVQTAAASHIQLDQSLPSHCNIISEVAAAVALAKSSHEVIPLVRLPK